MPAHPNLFANTADPRKRPVKIAVQTNSASTRTVRSQYLRKIQAEISHAAVSRMR